MSEDYIDRLPDDYRGEAFAVCHECGWLGDQIDTDDLPIRNSDGSWDIDIQCPMCGTTLADYYDAESEG